MHKNELFFRPSVFGYPARPPLSLPPPYTPLRGRLLAIPAMLQLQFSRKFYFLEYLAFNFKSKLNLFFLRHYSYHSSTILI